MVERRAGRSIAEILSTDGEDLFRSLEREVVIEALGGADAVVALGGGAVLDPDVRSRLAELPPST